MNITEFRQKNPDYNDLNDEQLTKALHQKFYSDLPFEQFAQKFMPQEAPVGGIPRPSSWMDEMSQQGHNYSPFPKSESPGFERDVLPILGDIGMSLLPTPFGKVKAATTLGKLGLGAAKTLFKSGQAATGSALGEGAAQQVYGEDADFGKMKDQALWGAVGEGASAILGPALKPIFKWATDLTLTGSSIKELYRKNLIKKTTKNAEQFIKDVAPDSIKTAGLKMDIDDLGVSVSKAFDETKVIYDAYGKHIDSMAKGPEGGILLDDLQQLIGEVPDVVETYGFKKGSKQATILNGIKVDEVVHPDDLKALLAEMYKKGKKSDFFDLTAGQKKARETLKKTILEDIVKQSPEAAVLKEAGDKAWGEISNFNRVQKIYNSALREMPSGDKFLNPTLLSKNIYKNEKVIKETMPDLWPKLKKEADYYSEVAHNWRPPDSNKFRSTVLGGLGMGASGTAAIAYMLGPQFIPVVESFGAVSAWMTLNPGARKILGQIAKNAIVKPAAHIAGPMSIPNFGQMGME